MPQEPLHIATGTPPPYLCAACGEPVFLIDNDPTRIYRPCGCPVDTGVLANISAVAYGQGKTVS